MSGSPTSAVLEAIHLRPGLGDRGVLRQGPVDDQFRPVGVREELLLRRSACRRATAANSSTVATMVTQRQRMAPSSTACRTRPCNAARCLAVMLLIVAGSMVTPSSGVNSTATIQETSSDTAMTTNSVKVIFAGGAVVQPDRNEARDRHQRAGQHREGGRGVDVGRSLAQGVADLQPRHHHLDRDHGVVDERPSAMISAPSEMRCSEMPR